MLLTESRCVNPVPAVMLVVPESAITAAKIRSPLEVVTAAVLVIALAAVVPFATFLATTSTVRYHKLALGELTAEARLPASREERAQVVVKLDAGGRPEFDVEVEVRNADGVVVATLTVGWTLRPNRV